MLKVAIVMLELMKRMQWAVHRHYAVQSGLKLSAMIVNTKISKRQTTSKRLVSKPDRRQGFNRITAKDMVTPTLIDSMQFPARTHA